MNISLKSENLGTGLPTMNRSVSILPTKSSHQICTNYAKKHYNLIRLYIQFMGYNPDSIFANIEKPDKVLIKIDYLQKTIMT